MAAPVRPQKAAAKQAAPQQQQAPPPPPAEPKGGRRSAMLPAIVVAIALLGAAFMMRGGGGGGTPAPPAQSSETTVAAIEHGDPAHVVALDPITLNLADGRFLKIGLALQLGEEAGEIADPAAFGARALDATIEHLGHLTYRELSQPAAREAAKDELSTAVAELYDGAVISVYFTEFVMQ